MGAVTVARVLVVEDEVNVRFVTVGALRLGGYDVSEVGTGGGKSVVYGQSVQDV